MNVIYAGIESLKLRTINISLRPNDQRYCSDCLNLFTGIAKHFYVKRYHDSIPAYETRCKNCSKALARINALKRKKNPEIHIPSLVSGFRHRAKVQQIPFNLDGPYLVQLFKDQNGRCYYTDEPLDFTYETSTRSSAHPLVPSLDKKEPKLGYVKGNVVWCVHKINIMKHDVPEHVFYKVCEQVLALKEKRNV